MFSQLGLSSSACVSLARLGYDTPTSWHCRPATRPKRVHSTDVLATRRGPHERRSKYPGARGHRTDGRRPISVVRLSGV